MEDAKISKEVKSEFFVSAVILNTMLMPQAARLRSAGAPIPPDLVQEINKTIGKLIRSSSGVSLALIEAEARVVELERQIASMLLDNPQKGA